MITCPSCHAALSDGARFCGACGQAFAPTETQAGAAPAATLPDLVGREIAGRYRIVAKLGEGGMGTVFRAEQISLKRAVALKLLRPEMSSNQTLLRRFNAEAELVAKLSHPNTVNIYDFGQDTDGSLFIAMELIEGPSLRQVLRDAGPLPPARALAIAAQLAASLTDAHAHGIIHRDLKPDNAMLASRGKERDVVRVLDFGIAKLRDDTRATQNMTQAGDMLGTPQYMAPEQIRAEAIDGRTDVYALGCILYEMLTARMPFEAPTVMALLSKHLMEQPVPPSQRRPDLVISPALDELCLVAMQKVPAARPPTMEAYGERIRALQRAYPSEGALPLAMPAPLTPVPVAPARIAPLIAPLIAPMGYAGFDERPPPPPEPLPMRPTIPTGPPAQIPLGYGGVSATNISSSGLAGARAAAGPTEMVDPLPRPAVARRPDGQLVTTTAPTSHTGRNLAIGLGLVGALVAGGVAIGVSISRREPATEGKADPKADPAPDPKVDPKADPWANAPDPWAGRATGTAPVAASTISTAATGVPASARLDPPFGSVRVFDYPMGQHYHDDGHEADVYLAPLDAGTNEPTALAAAWTRQHPTMKLRHIYSEASAGKPRPMLVFAGTLPSPHGVVAAMQTIVLYIEPGYRVAILAQAPVAAFANDPDYAKALDAFFVKGVSLP